MKKITFLSVFLLVTVACKAQKPTESVSKFAFDFYKYVSKDKSENVVFAPFSLTPAFGMVAIGSKAETYKQMSQVFYFPVNEPSFHTAMGKLQNKIQKDAGSNVDICITNRVWMEETFKVNRQYKKSLQKSYNAKVAFTSFIAQHEP